MPSQDVAATEWVWIRRFISILMATFIANPPLSWNPRDGSGLALRTLHHKIAIKSVGAARIARPSDTAKREILAPAFRAARLKPHGTRGRRCYSLGLLPIIFKQPILQNPFGKRKNDCFGAIRRFNSTLPGVFFGLDHDLAASIVAISDTDQLGDSALIS
jgi:hypothetical protein